MRGVVTFIGIMRDEGARDLRPAGVVVFNNGHDVKKVEGVVLVASAMYLYACCGVRTALRGMTRTSYRWQRRWSDRTATAPDEGNFPCSSRIEINIMIMSA
jgi:hypothetical protein